MMLTFYNTLSGKKEPLTPIHNDQVGMYVCGPTVYARPHIGNARSVVVYDVLYRLLSQLFPKVTYVRNITDVDDKINAAATLRGISIQQLTRDVTGWFHEDMAALYCLPPTIEPRATEHIAGMIVMIEQLIANGNAYVAEDGAHVLFNVMAPSPNPAWKYGMLSGRTVDEQQAGARVAVESYKRHPGDFVLWKPASEKGDPSSRFASPWGEGRPGWHIECSVMSTQYLGASFDIHGGGADLKFPHHENEIAQSCCANPSSAFARMWIHNGFLTVNGEKMSKSLGNFITVHELLEQGIKGEVIRLVLLSTKYNEPLDWNDRRVTEAQKLLDKLYRLKQDHEAASTVPQDIIEALGDDLNTPLALSVLQHHRPEEMLAAAAFLGFATATSAEWFQGGVGKDDIAAQIAERAAAKQRKDYQEADRIRDALVAQGIILEDKPGGETLWRRR